MMHLEAMKLLLFYIYTHLFFITSKFYVSLTFIYIAPRPPPRPRPRPRGVRPRPPRLPRPPRPLADPAASGVLPNSSNLEVSSFTSGVSPVEKFPDEFRRLLVNGVTQTDGILSRASVIRGSLILELVGSMSTAAGGRSSGSSAGSITTIVSSSAGGVTSVRLPPRPLPRPRGFCSIVGLSL